MDAIIIADPGEESASEIIPRFRLEGRTCSIQNVLNYLDHDGRIVPPVHGEGRMSWWSAYKLNGIFLLSYLTHQGFDVALINKYFRDRDRFRSALGEHPRAVIISTTFVRNKKSLSRLVADIRRLAPEVWIIAGGPFVYASYLIHCRSWEPDYETEGAGDHYLFLAGADPDVDLYVISLLGEKLLAEALSEIRRGRPVTELPNTAYRSGKGYRFNHRVDDVPQTEPFSITWGSLPDEIFQRGVVPIRASKGCPYQCAFCNFVKDRRLLHVKSRQELVGELRAVADRGVRYVWFVDDNFRFGRSIHEVCRRLVEENLGIQWMTMVRASALADVDPELLRKAGCLEVQMGLESADREILRNMRKEADPSLYSEVVGKLLASGIDCSCYFVFGFPGETEETAQRTLEFIHTLEHPEREGTLSWTLFPFSLAPLSPVYEPESRQKYQLTGFMDRWQHRTMDSEQAMEWVRKGFFELNNSAAIYRGDNLDLLQTFTPRQQKAFRIQRHRLTKQARESLPGKERVIKSFGQALGR